MVRPRTSRLRRLASRLVRTLVLALAVIHQACLFLGLAALMGWVVFSQGWWIHALPGKDIANLDMLHPEFRPVVDAVVADLEAQGWEVRVSSAWRSATRQEALFAIGQLGERMGQSPWSRVRGGQSCHNQVLADGTPASAAVDLAPGGVSELERRAEFYHALGVAAEQHGLRWGGGFSQSNAVWARYGMGWDPAHVELRRLCNQLRASR